MVSPTHRSLVRDVTAPESARGAVVDQMDRDCINRMAERARLQATGWTVLQAAAQTGRPQPMIRHAMFYGVGGAGDRLGYPDEWGVVRAFPQDVQRAFPKSDEAAALRVEAEQEATEPHHIRRARERMMRREVAHG